MLLQAGAEKDLRDESGFSALSWACDSWDDGGGAILRIPRVLLEQGAAKDVVDKTGRTALMLLSSS